MVGDEDLPTERQVLAIRSLAALGAPETLPFLLRTLDDTNGALRDAAREAITQIHEIGRAHV